MDTVEKSATVDADVASEHRQRTLDLMARLGIPNDIARKAFNEAVRSVEFASLAVLGAFWR